MKGKDFETKIALWLQNQGFKIKRIRERTKRLGEVDIVCAKKKWWGMGQDMLFVECKDKPTITGTDIVRFAEKVRKGLESGKVHRGLFVYRGELDPNAEKAIRVMDDDIRDSIQFKKWPSRK
jgi:hypothetical protein